MNALPYLYIPPDAQPGNSHSAWGATPRPPGSAPLLVVVPHAGTRVGRAEAARVTQPESVRLHDADLHAERLVDTTAVLGGHLIVGTISRWICDVDRDAGDLDQRACPELVHTRAEHPRGVIWRETTDGLPCLEGALSRTEVQDRLTRIHAAFHSKVEATLEALTRLHGHAWVLDLRTVPSVGRKADADAGRKRPPVTVSEAGAPAPAAIAEIIREFGRAKVPVARQLHPLPSYLARRHADAARNVSWITLTLSRRLYLHEEVPFWAGAPALELQTLTRALVGNLVQLASAGRS